MLFGIKKSLICAVILLVAKYVDGQQKLEPSFYKKSKNATFAGIIHSTQKVDSVSVLFHRDTIWPHYTSSGFLATGSIFLKIIPDSKGRFRFTLDNVDHLGYLTIIFYIKRKFIPISNEFIVEPGDSIILDTQIDGENVTTSYKGRNAEKYECIDLFGYGPRELWYSFLDKYGIKKNGASYDVYFDSLRIFCDKFIIHADSLVFPYKDKISPDVFKLIKINYSSLAYGTYLLNVEATFDSLYNGPMNYSNQKTLNFWRSIYKDKIDTTHSELKSLSNYWLFFVTRDIAMELSMHYNRLPTIIEMANEMILNYRGLLVDKLLGNLIDNPFNDLGFTKNSIQVDSVIEIALSKIKTPYIQTILKWEMVLKIGSEAYDFNLDDTNNLKVQLSDFKGKVVLIDTWYTGCTGCAIFYKMFKDSVEPLFHNDSTFKIVSINADRSKMQWHKSLYKGIYTNQEVVNLYTGGFNRSDFFNYYKASGCPFVLLIDRRGKIAEWAYGLFGEDIQKTKEKITEVLAEK